jgi:hypothetical protein
MPSECEGRFFHTPQHSHILQNVRMLCEGGVGVKRENEKGFFIAVGYFGACD